jgi:hypothetical protein
VLLDPPFETIDGRIPKVVDVIDPEIEGIENTINTRIWSARLAGTNGADEVPRSEVRTKATAGAEPAARVSPKSSPLRRGSSANAGRSGPGTGQKAEL